MFSSTFIYHLLSNNCIDKKQAREILSKRISKVRPAVVAVFEGLMTEEQAKTIMSLQASNDMPFGFLAVREGFLTHEQSAAISGRKQREDMFVMQTLSDKGIMSMKSVMDNLELFRERYNLDEEAYEAIVANKPECYVEHIAGVNDGGLFSKYIFAFIKIFEKCVDSSLRIERAYSRGCVEGEYLAKVKCTGDRNVVLGFALDDEPSVLNIAGRFLRQKQNEYDEDVEDTIKEFMNIVAGLFATVLEKDLGLDVDLFAPEMVIGGKLQAGVEGGAVNVVNVYSSDGSAKILLAEI